MTNTRMRLKLKCNLKDTLNIYFSVLVLMGKMFSCGCGMIFNFFFNGELCCDLNSELLKKPQTNKQTKNQNQTKTNKPKPWEILEAMWFTSEPCNTVIYSVLAYSDIGNEYPYQELNITAIYLIELWFGKVMQDSNF